jgi:3D (Asp-Asp-Asp) domain-containing protein
VIISGSFWRKSFVTATPALGIVWLYEVTALDSKYAARLANPRETEALPTPAPGMRLPYISTAYCKGMLTTSGVAVQSGIAAADPALLPVGSVVEIDSLPQPHNGVYTILDTGPAVQGRQIDIYMWSCNEALAFGRRAMHLRVLRLGWNPRATTPGFLDRFFKRPEPSPLPARPLPQALPSSEPPDTGARTT